MMVRYDLLWEEAGDFILDNETGEYLTIEDACNLLNDFEELLKSSNMFFRSLARKINESDE